MGHTDPFAKRAPEIAEEILRKSASLPEGLREFSRSLMNKSAQPEDDFEVPERMTLEDLRKTAAGKQATEEAPKIAQVSIDSALEFAGLMEKTASANEQEVAQDILAAAAAAVVEQEKVARGPGVSRVVSRVPSNTSVGNYPGFFKRWFTPGGRMQAKEINLKHQRTSAKIKEQTPGDPLHEASRKSEAAGKERELTEKAISQQHDRGTKMTETLGKALPGAAVGTGIGVAGTALALKPAPKREDYKVIK